MSADKSKKKKRRLSSMGQLCVFLLIILILVFTVAHCAAEKRAQNYKNDNSSLAKTTAKQAVLKDKDVVSKVEKNVYASTTAATKELEISSKYGILIDLNSNEVIAQKNSDTVMYPASLTKIMTLLVAVENIDNLDARYTFSAELIDPLVADEASRAGFEPGETVTMRDILYGAILPSGADATSAIADYVAGNEANFVELMNKKVTELGLKHTHFSNASGLHDKKHYTTVHDIAVILKESMKNPVCAEILSTYTYTTEKNTYHPDGIELYSTMFSRMYGNEAVGVNIKAGKTGYTTEGGNCLASYAVANDKEYILVTADAKGQYKPIYDAITVYAQYAGSGETTLTADTVNGAN